MPPFRCVGHRPFSIFSIPAGLADSINLAQRKALAGLRPKLQLGLVPFRRAVGGEGTKNDSSIALNHIRKDEQRLETIALMCCSFVRSYLVKLIEVIGFDLSHQKLIEISELVY